jgi:NAD(P)-dependent dehydrogenase (short-subunit alcohol dehydrogenase family)
MTELKDKVAVVTGGSRGLGRGIVEVLAAEGVNVWAIARDAGRLDLLKQEVKGVQTRAADVSDPQVASQTLREIRPDILVLNAGTTPTIKPVHEQSWEEFSRVWENDVKATFHFGKEALLLPMPPGGVVIIVSSGAAIGGSPLSGGYAGAKRTQWFLAQYLQEESNNLKLGIRFAALVPRQIVGTTDLGRPAAAAYAARQGISVEAYLERFGAPLTPEKMGHGVVALLTDSAHQDGVAFGINGKGLESLS